jgi:citrate lyase subunit beta/citryl-CoA lyase
MWGELKVMDTPVTYLFVPGDRPDRLSKALATSADRVILDLEDAVQHDAKPAARAAILAADLDWARIVVRINDSASPYFGEDREFLRRCPVSSILLPKAENPHAVAQIRAACGRNVEVISLIETAKGLDAMSSLLSAPGVTRAAFGHLDFALDLGCKTDWETLHFFRSQIVLRSRLAGALPPIDGVTTDLKNPNAVKADAEAARRLGFGGKLLIHPDQVAPVESAFSPTLDEINWAKKVIMASRGKAGAVALDGKMIDKPVIKAAQSILSRARAAKD